ncbi:cation diffusion facilitator family transporter [Desulfoferrobacter suflitae]|uniref:cation diffusion facilitator family transporter n=1 Tax=Desulfoferrobacter suflitae TaxID=2865782 RepID=UPI0021645ECE|nr:cation diffusion facilitator family transporter [Desulfoferrobacter suflitae]MCK8601865.1 cation diffusion facilitator family transporter [Desulfoferrobacter suflitae]
MEHREAAPCCLHEQPSHDHGDQGDHSHLAGHCHVDVRDTSGSRLLITLGLNLLIPIAQVIGGLYAHSMALISDAAHNFSDFTAVLIAYVANRIGMKGATTGNTFGYRRAEILAAVINVALLLGAGAFIIYMGLHRLGHPEAVLGRWVALIAGIGVAGNGLSAWLLHRDSKHNLNVRGAFLHMLGDLLTSVVVLINGLVLMFKPWYWLDPILSILIALFIFKNCWSILKEATRILMNATPSTIDINRVRDYLENMPGILGVHYLHAWNVSSSSVAFSCHVVVPDQQLSRVDHLSDKVRRHLNDHFGIDHPILQFETAACGNGGILCELSCARPDNGPSSVEDKPSSTGARRLQRQTIKFWARLLLGAIFIFASIDKIWHPILFAEAVYNYQILPDAAVNLTAILLPWLELVLGVLLVFGLWLPGTVLLANMLLVSFFGALLFNSARGLDVHCGCFTTSTAGDPATTWYLIRDGSFLIVGGYLFYRELIAGKGER